jgi:DNA (cytosine-5)-methyltransferase 1
MTKFKEWNINEPVNLLVGGTPCQSFSVAGLRKGLDDPRGNLMLTYLAMADHFKPKWLLWENVPGVLSSNRGHDFAALLQGLAQLGYGFAYRVLDAQYFGVPQRRRRVFVVGCLGDWRSAAKVLFESESLCRDITPSREKGKEVANCLTKSPSSYSSFNPARSEGNAVICADVAPTMTSNGPPYSRTGNSYVESEALVAFDAYNNSVTGNVTKTLDTGSDYHHVPNVFQAVDTYNGTIQGDVTATMTADMGGPTHSGPKLMHNMRVRRITPMECERLQGFPDNYTNTLTSSDATRYRALGNSMAVPVMKWIGQRINELS